MARKTQRGPRAKQQRAELLAVAKRAAFPSRCDVCVVGGGAAGLVAAIVAARAGARVVVVERDVECGRTILATGNGRCNFANASLDPARYNDPAFVAAACGPTWLQDVLSFFRDCGLAWAQEDDGRLYPLSRQAASVRNVLLAQLRAQNVACGVAREVVGLRRTSRGFDVGVRDLWDGGEEHPLHARAVILASGGAHTQLARELGIAYEPPVPLLCPIACESDLLLAALDGRRARATAALVRDGNVVACEKGEVLFRDYGLSGICVFNLSRHARTGDVARLDLLDGLGLRDALSLCAATLDGVLDPVIAQALAKTYGSNESALKAAKALPFVVSGPAETSHAQVRRGGLATNEFVCATLEASHVPGFFACGEVLNVDGPCGGFNLAWAWKSGMVAGTAAARRVLA